MRIERLWRLMKPELVVVNDQTIADSAGKLAEQELFVPNWQIPDVLPVKDVAFLSWLPYLCATNFASTNFHRPYDKFRAGKFTGSVALGHCFHRYFGEGRIHANDMLRLTADLSKTEQFFRGTDGLPPLITQRRDQLLEVVQVLARDFSGDPMNLLLQADFNAEQLIAILCRSFPKTYGSDFVNLAEYISSESLAGCPKTFPFNKKALLFALMYQGRALHSDGELPPLNSLDRLQPLADTSVPNALRKLEILRYHSALQYKIDNCIYLPKGGREESEIRLGTIYAVVSLLRSINRWRVAYSRPNVSLVQLDHYLWQVGRESGFRPHLTMTTAY